MSSRSVTRLIKMLVSTAVGSGSSVASTVRASTPLGFVLASGSSQMARQVHIGFALWTQRPPSRHFASRYLQFQNSKSYGSKFFNANDPEKVLWGLIIANASVFLLWRGAPHFCSQHFVVSNESILRRPWSAVGAAFSHNNLMHFGANMISLYFFGRDIAMLFGGKRLLYLYLAGGIAGSIAHCLWYSSSSRYFSPGALGASAAVNSIMIVDILLFPTRTILLYGFIPVPAALLGGLWLYRDVDGSLSGHGSLVAHAGHLGGAAMGLLFWIFVKKGRILPRRYY